MWQNGEGMTDTNEFIQTLEGELTAEQVDQLIHGPQGDTDAKADDEGSAPGAATEADASKQNSGAEDAGSSEEGAEAELNADNAVVMARDNKHTIPFEKLEEAREGQKHWRAQAEAAQQELERLQAEAQARADAGEAPTKQDNQIAAAEAAIEEGVDPELFGDFSEEALAKGINTLVQQQVEQRLQAALAPYEQREAQSATEAHYDAIYAAHPDADSIAQSKELSDWISSQPTFVQGSMTAVLQEGTTEQIIELFSTFKSSTGATQADGKLTADAVKAAAKQKVASAKEEVPASLSDFPGGRAGATSRSEAMHDMSDGVELAMAMDDMTPEQIEQFLNRL